MMIRTTIAFSVVAAESSSKKTILVTGANKGIGRAICERLLTEYDDTRVIMACRNLQRGQKARQEILNSISTKNNEEDRLGCLEINVASDESVQKAARTFEQSSNDENPSSLYAIINNAGIAYGYKFSDVVNINYFGTQRVNRAFGPFLIPQKGRIVHMASASGPAYIRSCSNEKLKAQLVTPLQLGVDIQQLNALALDTSDPEKTCDPYGFSKALVNAYNVILAQEMNEKENGILVNACTPGFIATDMTRGMGASNTPLQGATPPIYLAMSNEIAQLPSGRYYGSDCKRSPIFKYRNPGDPEYKE